MDIQTKDGILLRGIPDGTPDDVIKARIEQIRGGAPTVRDTGVQTESAGMRSGRQMNSSAQGAMTALQGPSMGFLDEVAGVGSGLFGLAANLTPWGDDKSFAENYRSARDKVRGANAQFTEDYPATAIGTSLAASAPTIAAAPFRAATVPAVVGAGSKVYQAAKTGAAYGAVGGAGQSTSENPLDVAVDAGKGAALNAVMGAGVSGAGSVIGAVGSNVAQRVRAPSATNAAQEKVTEALLRDSRGTAFTAGGSDPLNQVSTRLSKLGPEATITDAAGRNTNALLDTVATLPGRGKDVVERVIHDRQAGRAARLTSAADDALGTQGRGYSATLEALDSARRNQAAPLYAQLEGLSVRLDDDLHKLITASESAHRPAELLARLRQELPLDLSRLRPGDDVPFAALDKVKQSLYDLGQSAKQSGNRTLGRDYDGLRQRLTEKMDDISPRDQGGSIYRQARDAYAGPSQLRDAVEAGRGAMKADAIGVSELTRGMSQSEREAFRVGALQSIKDKVGTEAGQTSLLKMWKEPATSGKLREIFGNDYRQFASAVAAEARLKPMESVGRGSQTAARIYGAGDLDASALADTGRVITSASQGNVGGTLSAVSNIWNRVKTPETVRDELVRILLSRGQTGRDELQGLSESARRVAEARMRAAAISGAGTGTLAPQVGAFITQR